MSEFSEIRKAARELSDDEFIQIVQDRTGFPFFNGAAYVKFAGWYAFSIHARSACDDFDDLIKVLRAEKHYFASDRIRTINDRLRKQLNYVRPDMADRGQDL